MSTLMSYMIRLIKENAYESWFLFFYICTRMGLNAQDEQAR